MRLDPDRMGRRHADRARWFGEVVMREAIITFCGIVAAVTWTVILALVAQFIFDKLMGGRL